MADVWSALCADLEVLAETLKVDGCIPLSALSDFEPKNVSKTKSNWHNIIKKMARV